MPNISGAIFLLAPILGAHNARATDLSTVLNGLTSTQVTVREAAFTSLLSLGSTATGPINVPQQIAAVIAANPTAADGIRVSLINLLALENSYGSTVSAPASAADEPETDYGEYYADAVIAVASLRDLRSVSVLLPHLSSGRAVIDTMASFGRGSIDAVLTMLYRPGSAAGSGAEFTLLQMLAPENYPAINDSVTQAKIAAGLRVAFQLEADDPYMQALISKGIKSLPPSVPGDLNGDGVANCADRTFVINRLGAVAGQAEFDIRADLNGDGVITGVDVGIEASTLGAKNRACR